MICVGCFLLYLAIVKEFEPLILLPMAFGMILANLPGSGIIHMQYFVGDGLEHPMWVEILNNGGLADMLYMGVKLGIYPPLIFLGIGTMTDFEPLIARPSSLLLGAAAQLGIFFTFVGAKILGFTNQEAGAIGIIGGADGPVAIVVGEAAQGKLHTPRARRCTLRRSTTSTGASASAKLRGKRGRLRLSNYFFCAFRYSVGRTPKALWNSVENLLWLS